MSRITYTSSSIAQRSTCSTRSSHASSSLYPGAAPKCPDQVTGIRITSKPASATACSTCRVTGGLNQAVSAASPLSGAKLSRVFPRFQPMCIRAAACAPVQGGFCLFIYNTPFSLRGLILPHYSTDVRNRPCTNYMKFRWKIVRLARIPPPLPDKTGNVDNCAGA